MPLDWVNWIDYNRVTFSVELLEGVWDKEALAGSYFASTITPLSVLIYMTCYQISLQDPKAKPNLVPKALFPGGAEKAPWGRGWAGSICPCFV